MAMIHEDYIQPHFVLSQVGCLYEILKGPCDLSGIDWVSVCFNVCLKMVVDNGVNEEPILVRFGLFSENQDKHSS